MLILFLVLLTASVFLVWALMRDKEGRLPWQNRPANPWYALEKDFAEGRISREVYEARKAALLEALTDDDPQNEVR